MGGTVSTAEMLLAARLFAMPSRDRPDGAVPAFERAFAQAAGASHAISFGAGRVSLWAILKALGVGAGDEVIVPGYTCVAVPNAVRFAGAQPAFADIDPC